MGWFTKAIGVDTAVDAFGNAIDKIFTSDEERLQAQALLVKIKQRPQILQGEINKIEAAHPSIFVSGWRPAIGWICAGGLGYGWIIKPFLQFILMAFDIQSCATIEDATICTVIILPSLPMQDVIALVLALLGMAGFRMVEKRKGVARS